MTRNPHASTFSMLLERISLSLNNLSWCRCRAPDTSIPSVTPSLPAISHYVQSRHRLEHCRIATAKVLANACYRYDKGSTSSREACHYSVLKLDMCKRREIATNGSRSSAAGVTIIGRPYYLHAIVVHARPMCPSRCHRVASPPTRRISIIAITGQPLRCWLQTLQKKPGLHDYRAWLTSQGPVPAGDGAP